MRQFGTLNPNAYTWLVYGPVRASSSCPPCRLDGLIPRLVHHIWAGYYAAQTRASLGQPESSQKRAPPLPLPFQPPSAADAGWGEQETHPATASTEPVLMATAPVPAHQISVWMRQRALEVLFALCCDTRLPLRDVRRLDMPFLDHLLDQVEATRESEDESFNMLITRVIVAVNEQGMLAAYAANDAALSSVTATLQRRQHNHKTFGENLVFMLNRTPSSTFEGIRIHLLVLKLLDELFSHDATASFFYTNDLKVLMDIFLRELTDLPDECELLRQVYLRVLHAMTTHTQLHSIMYKRYDTVQLLYAIGSAPDVCRDTRRLVHRCLEAMDSPDLLPAEAGTTDPVSLQNPSALAYLQASAAATAYARGTVPNTALCLWPAPDEPEVNEPVSFEWDLDALSARSAQGIGRRRRPPPPRPQARGAPGSTQPSPTLSYASDVAVDPASVSMPELRLVDIGTRRPAPPRPVSRGAISVHDGKPARRRAPEPPKPPRASPRTDAPTSGPEPATPQREAQSSGGITGWIRAHAHMSGTPTHTPDASQLPDASNEPAEHTRGYGERLRAFGRRLYTKGQDTTPDATTPRAASGGASLTPSTGDAAPRRRPAPPPPTRS